MSAIAGNQDSISMKDMLNSWHVGELYELFKEEDITVNELKMMQINHIYDLLKDYKMGVRIRFEHNLNNWRKKIGIPLKAKAGIHHHAICCNCNTNIRKNSMEELSMEDATTNRNVPANDESNKISLDQNGASINQMEFNENQPPLSPQSVNSTNSLLNVFTSNEIVNFVTPPVLETPRVIIHKTDDEAELENMPLSSLADSLSLPGYDAPPKFPSKPEVTLEHILNMSGTRGKTIMKYFKEKNRLTTVHRSQLIQAIVDFFDENDFHLSLNISHNLEWEIIKMFPTEKLEYYRTEKRGKIYVKFSNMKRYKRERRKRAKALMESIARRSLRFQAINKYHNVVDNVAQDNSEIMDTKDIEKGYTDPEVLVKEENFID